jgi:hypothetical protein
MTRTLRARKPRPDAPKPDDHSESEAETKPRMKRTKLSQPPQPGDDDSTFANTAGPSMSASRKAPKKTKGKPKKAGKLAQLPNMPLDILFEVLIRCIPHPHLTQTHLPLSCLDLRFIATFGPPPSHPNKQDTKRTSDVSHFSFDLGGGSRCRA